MLEELNVEPKQRADEKMVLLENEKKEDTQLDEANKIDTIAEDKHALSATLISHIDFVILKIFKDVMEHLNFLFVVLLKVILDLSKHPVLES